MSEGFLDRYGPCALVTGASSGIGLAFAEVLAERGFNLVLAARRRVRMEELAARLEQRHGTRSRIVEADLSRPEAPEAVLAATSDLDVGLLVSNAGFNLKGSYEAGSASAIAKMLMVNCNAPMQLAHGFVPRLKARGRGGMIFTSSVEGLIGCPYSTAYSSSKSLVKTLGEGLWAELRMCGIEVLTLCPGATESEATEGFGLTELQPAREVAELTLDNIANGPTFVPNEKYRGMFDQILARPREEALIAMEESMRFYSR